GLPLPKDQTSSASPDRRNDGSLRMEGVGALFRNPQKANGDGSSEVLVKSSQARK
ncbi:MAG: hypothetical protein Q9215_003018, partial [Flavoplaca cf. flavocitrina]